GYALAIGNREQLGIEDLPPEFVSQGGSNSMRLEEILRASQADGAPLAEIEKRYILSMLQQFDGNQVKTAAALGIDRSKLYRRLRHYGVKAVKFLQEDSDGMQLLSSRKEKVDSPGVKEEEVALSPAAASGE